MCAIFGQNLRDSGKYFACFLLIGFVCVPSITFDCVCTCIRAVLWQNIPQMSFIGACGRHSFWMAVEKSRKSQHCLFEYDSPATFGGPGF